MYLSNVCRYYEIRFNQTIVLWEKLQALLRFGRFFFSFSTKVSTKHSREKRSHLCSNEGRHPYLRMEIRPNYWKCNVYFPKMWECLGAGSPGIRIRRGPQYLLHVLKGAVHRMRQKKPPMFRVTARSLPVQRPSKGNLVQPFSSNGNRSLEGKIVKGDVKR